jgi:MYXO-CTERM domain-containing protein
MKRTLLIFALTVFATALGMAQTTDRTTDNSYSSRHETEPGGHNWGWVGLLGLAGLAGLRRRKSEDVRKLEASGVNVRTL